MSHLNTVVASPAPVAVTDEVKTSAIASLFQAAPVATSLAVTLATLCLIEILTMLGLTIPDPPMVYLLAVVYCSYAAGTAAGLLSALICLLYSAYFMFIASHLAPQPDRVSHLLVLSITTPLIAVLVGHQTSRFKHAMQQLRDNLVASNRRQRQRKNVQLKAQKERLDYLRQHDTVTGLPNRSQFIGLAATALTDQSTCTVLVVGIDRSRSAHQVLAYAFQRTVLRSAGERIQGCLSDADIVAFLRGDEFVVLLNGLISENHVQAVASRIKGIVQEPYRIEEQDIYIDVHLGAAVYPIDAPAIGKLVDLARLAMHNESRTPSGTCLFYSRKLGEEAAYTQGLANDLHHAVGRGELFLHYQPRVHARTGELVGVEALVRWQHPVHGMVSPLTFIPLAEESGLIVPVGEWVLRTACKQAVAWQAQRMPPLRMAVNISARQFHRNDFLTTLKTVLLDTGMPATSLELEITESMLMDDPDAAVAILQEIHATGVQIAIDDFGTGYSSLSYLKRFPIHCLKIDRAFIRDLPNDRSDLAITRAIIALAHSLNMKVVAEGVGTRAQQKMLMSEGCDEFQGYLFSKPVTAREMDAYLPAKAQQCSSVTNSHIARNI